MFYCKPCIQSKSQIGYACQFPGFLQRQPVYSCSALVSDIGVKSHIPCQVADAFEQTEESAGAHGAPSQGVGGEAVRTRKRQIVEDAPLEYSISFGGKMLEFKNVGNTVRERHVSPAEGVWLPVQRLVEDAIPQRIAVLWPQVGIVCFEVKILQSGLVWSEANAGRRRHFVPDSAEPALLELFGEKQDRIGGDTHIILPEAVEAPVAGTYHLSVFRFDFIEVNGQDIAVVIEGGINHFGNLGGIEVFPDGVGVPVFFVADTGGHVDIFEQFELIIGVQTVLHTDAGILERLTGE